MERVKGFRINRRLALIIFIVIVWSIPLFLPAETLERFALDGEKRRRKGGREAVARKAVTVYLDEAAYQRLRELIAPKTISRELDDLIRKRIAELEGKEYDPFESADYEELKREYERLLKETEKMERTLKKRGTYQKLVAVTDEIEEELGTKDLKTVAPMLLDRWDEDREDAHLFISFLEKLKKMKEAEKQLEEIRRGGRDNG